jgi:hypothetical protein
MCNLFGIFPYILNVYKILNQNYLKCEGKKQKKIGD